MIFRALTNIGILVIGGSNAPHLTDSGEIRGVTHG